MMELCKHSTGRTESIYKNISSLISTLTQSYRITKLI